MLPPVKVLALRRPDACSGCARPLSAGTKAAWDAAERRTYCLSCRQGLVALADPPALTPTEPDEVTLEQAGWWWCLRAAGV